MAKNSVLGSPSHVARLPKQGFNLSHSLKFTSSCGQLLPVMFDHLRVGEKVRLNVNLFTRTQPLASAAMADIFEYIDFFFVPLRKLYHNFDQLIMSVDDFNSVALSEKYSSLSNFVIPPLNTSSLRNIVMGGNLDSGTNQYSVYGHYFDYQISGSVRLCDLLEFVPNMFCAYDSGGTVMTVPEDYFPSLNPSVLLAYQAIYYDYYRLSNWESNYNKAYNLDDVSNVNHVPLTDYTRLRQIFSLRYRPYQRDYFKAIEPSPLLSPIGTLGLTGTFTSVELRQWLGLQEDVYNAVNSEGSGPGVFGDSLTNVALQQEDSSVLSLSSLRTAYAFEKLLKITNRAGKHYDDQVLAHFGFKVPRGISEEVYYLGSYTSKLTIGEVVATADTATTGVSNLAEIAGKGYNIKTGNNGNMSDIDFVAPCDGILMAVYSCVPKLSYVVALNRLHTRLTKYDYPQPELDNLGMQPLFGYQGFAGQNNASLRVGWQYRYMESKVKYNRATHNFLGEYTYGQDLQASGMQHDWALARLPFLSDLNFDVSDWQEYLLCRPTDLNDIFVIQYRQDTDRQTLAESAWYNELYARDPLIHDVSFKYYKTSFMSTFGIDDVDI